MDNNLLKRYKDFIDDIFLDIEDEILYIHPNDRQSIEKFEKKFRCKIINCTLEKICQLEESYTFEIKYRFSEFNYIYKIENGITNGTILVDIDIISKK